MSYKTSLQHCLLKFPTVLGTEPGLQPLSGEFLKYKTVNDVDDACVDIVVENFWCLTDRRAILMSKCSILLPSLM